MSTSRRGSMTAATPRASSAITALTWPRLGRTNWGRCIDEAWHRPGTTSLPARLRPPTDRSESARHLRRDLLLESLPLRSRRHRRLPVHLDELPRPADLGGRHQAGDRTGEERQVLAVGLRDDRAVARPIDRRRRG